MTLEDLPVEDYEQRCSGFIAQHEEDMCYTVCIVNTLNDLGKREGVKGLKFSLQRMNTLCGYRKGLQCQDAIVPRVIDEQLQPFQFDWKEKIGPDISIDLLRDVSSNSHYSSPLVNVSGDYFEYVGGRSSGRHKLDHVLIVMGVNHKIIYYYDPYETFLGGDRLV